VDGFHLQTHWCYLANQFYYFADMLLSSCDKKEKYVPNVKQQHIFLPHTAACPD